MSILCTLQNINLTFGTKHLFNNASLSIDHGDKIGLLGLNGHGKSSLFKILTKEVVPDTSTPPFTFAKTKGDKDPTKEFSVFMVPQELSIGPNKDITISNYIFNFYPDLKEIHYELQRINKDFETIKDPAEMDVLIERQKVLLEKYEYLNGWNITQSYQSYLKFFGLNNLESRIADLSGGEQKKILLSLGFSSSANLILWDEPTNHLDLDTIKLFETELSQFNKAFILVTHDRYLLSKVTDKIFHIQHGEIQRFEGNYSEYLEYLDQEESSREKLLEKLRNSLRRETDWMRQGIKARGCRSKKRVEEFHGLSGKVTELKNKAKKNLSLTISDSQRKTKVLTSFEDVCFAYNDKDIFNGLKLSIHKKDKIGLIGPNGAGKTTLVNMVANKLAPTSGKVKRAEQLLIQHFTQKREELDPEKTPFEILGNGTDFVELPNGNRKHVTTYFESFLFNKTDLNRPLKTFSGGERNRLQMAINLKTAGDLWIFDEPTNDLDLETLQILESKLLEFDGSVILISHDRAFLSSVTNKVWLLEDKNITNFEGGYSQVEPYLEAATLERLMKENAPEKDNGKSEQKNDTEEDTQITNVEKSNQKIKLTNKEKSKLKQLPKEIEKLEKLVKKLEDEATSFDFSNMDQEKSLQYTELTDRKDEHELKLLELYEELEELESRK